MVVYAAMKQQQASGLEVAAAVAGTLRLLQPLL
jgi:hypothetical protein